LKEEFGLCIHPVLTKPNPCTVTHISVEIDFNQHVLKLTLTNPVTQQLFPTKHSQFISFLIVFSSTDALTQNTDSDSIILPLTSIIRHTAFKSIS